MSDETKNQDSKQGGDVDVGPGYFPTSAQPVFVKIGLLVAGVVALCAAVYMTSVHEEKPKERKSNRNQEILSDYDD